MSSFEGDEPNEDDPLQAMIGEQLRLFYDSVLSEPLPDQLLDLLNQLDSVPGPGEAAPNQASDTPATDDQGDQ